MHGIRADMDQNIFIRSWPIPFQNRKLAVYFTNMWSWKRENAECVQRLCIIYFDFFSSGNTTFQTREPYFLLTRLLLGSCWIAAFPLKTAGKQQQSSKPIRRWKESDMASIDHFMFKNSLRILKNILQSLCTHSAFLVFQNPKKLKNPIYGNN